MRYKEILDEEPEIRPEELTFDTPMRPFYSQQSLDREFNVVYDGADGIMVVMRHDHATSSIGKRGLRPLDNKPGMSIIGSVDFKHELNLSGRARHDLGPKVLQVSLARIDDTQRIEGYGFRLYFELAKAGYTIISDNLQYLGGQALWRKIAQLSHVTNYKVYVMDEGEFRLDADDKPIVYDGSNIDDSELWSTDSSRRYTLFALKV
jgi:hypothetical protein